MIALGCEPRSVWLQSLSAFTTFLSQVWILYHWTIKLHSETNSHIHIVKDSSLNLFHLFLSFLLFFIPPHKQTKRQYFSEDEKILEDRMLLHKRTCISIPKDTNDMFNFWISEPWSFAGDGILSLSPSFQCWKSVLYHFTKELSINSYRSSVLVHL